MCSYHRYTDHHVVPRSRGGERTVELPASFHESWHVLFQDMHSQEIILFIEDVQRLFEQKDKITSSELHDLRKEIKEMEVNSNG